MNKKKFPKAVLRTAEQMREAPAPEVAMPTPQPETPDNVIEMMPKADAATAPQRAAASDAEAARLRRQAIAIVERYANWSMIGGAVPVPLANATVITGLLVRMVQKLSALYGVPFERTRTRSIVIGLMGGALPTGFATIATSTMTYFVPGLNVMGLAVSSVTSGAYARSIGQLFIEHFENGAPIDFRTIVKR